MERTSLRGIVNKLAHRGSTGGFRKTSTYRHRYQTRLEQLEERALLSTYSFTRIADNTGIFSSLTNGAFGAPTINNTGVVAFGASLRAGGAGIYTASGGPLQTIIDTNTNGYITRAVVPAINDADRVAFFGLTKTGLTGIYTSDGGNLTTIAESGGSFRGFGSAPSINDAGRVALSAYLNGGAQDILSGDGGSLTTIASNDIFGSDPSINDNGVVVFGRAPSSPGVFTGNGAGLTTIVDSSGPISGYPGEPVINDSGAVAFSGLLKSGGAGVFTGNGSLLVRVADTQGAYSSVGPPAINSAGNVVFTATLNSGGSGIFEGSDPTVNRVIGVGDVLDGSTVAQVYSGRFALNDNGQVAILAILSDGREGYYRADPQVNNPIVVVSATAYQMVKAPFDSSTIPVPPTQNINPGIGIRPNTDDDNNNGTPDYLDGTVIGEHDLIRVNLSTSLALRPENLHYYLSRESFNLQAWDHPDKSGTPIFALGSLTSSAFDISGVSRDIWVEWASPDTGTSSIVLQAKADTFVAPLSEAKINFFSDGTIPNARDLGVLVGFYAFHDSFRATTSNNDYTEFRIVDTSMVNISLESDRINSDLRLFDITGTKIIDSSQHMGLAGDSISLILQPGTYYTQVIKQALDLGDDYTISLSGTQLLVTPATISGVVSMEGNGNVDPITLHRIDGLPIQDPLVGTGSVRTWVVIHGRGDSADGQGSTIPGLAQAIDGYSPGDQVLTLDWHDEAAYNPLFPLTDFAGADWITTVGQWAARTLRTLQIPTDSLNLVGHSWGSYVSYELALSLLPFGKVHSLVALDPARDSTATLSNSYNTSKVHFDSVSSYSWGFEGSFAGDEAAAATASETFAEYVPGTFSIIPGVTIAESHGNVVRLFTTMVSLTDPIIGPVREEAYLSRHFALGNLLDSVPGPWALNQLPTYSGFEAIITGVKDKDAGYWLPQSIEYRVIQEGNLVGVRESVKSDPLSERNIDSVGNTIPSATSLGILNRSLLPIKKWVGLANNADYFTFSTDQANIIRVQFTGLASNAIAFLLDANGHLIDGGIVSYMSSFTSVGKMPKGKYYIYVTYLATGLGYRSDVPDSPYQLIVSATPR